MKTRFNTYDLACSVTELQKFIGMRVAQIYDIDNKTYLIKLQRTEEKAVLLLESGNRIHSTAFEWPKNVAPCGFSMKMRKHLKNKRLESLKQFGMDRIVDLQFGSGDAAYHVILELYDRGNIILTDCDLTILYILRPHTEGEVLRFAVREKYPSDRGKEHKGPPSEEELREILLKAKPNDGLKRILNPHLEYGPAVIEHVLLKAGFTGNSKVGKTFHIDTDLPRLVDALNEAESLVLQAMKEPSKGYIIQKKQKRPLPDGGEEDFFSNEEFHPMLFQQYANLPHKEFPSFDAAVDEFFSTLESQKIDMKAVQQEREAMKRLSNVQQDHDRRLKNLAESQGMNVVRAELIARNQDLVDSAISMINAAMSKQMPWEDINELVRTAQKDGDHIANAIQELKLQTKHISMLLSDPYADDSASDDDDDELEIKPMVVDIALYMNAFSNARRYYDHKKYAAQKQQKTLDAHKKAMKSAEKKAKQTLKEVQTITNITKARKVYWFEKFYWFISSENYLVIGGRDQQQNELIVKRYMKSGDIYVHADISGASSVVIKNPSGQPVPPKTLDEAGTMAVAYSVAWEAKVLTRAWWVHSDQVSKTAPAGEYLTTGSFMIRGRKNYLLPCHLIMGFSFLFKVEDSSVFRHKDERKIRTVEDDVSGPIKPVASLEFEIELDATDDEDDSDGNARHREGKNNLKNQVIPEEDKTLVIDIDRKLRFLQHNSDDDTNVFEFPDTEIQIQLNETNQLTIKTKGTLVFGKPSESNNSEEQVVYLGDDKPVVIKSTNTQQKNPKNKTKPQKVEKQKEKQKEPVENTEDKQCQLKRGQRSKLKKIKEKYKDQDEEDRKLIMDFLQPAGSKKETKRGKKGREIEAKAQKTKVKKPQETKPKPATVNGEDDESDGEVEEVTAATDVDMLNSLTGIPHPEDELLFAVPVVAPYSVLHNYKFKVKLTPGTGKRGKAARTAMNIFLKDRNTSSREKDLIRSVKDENMARYLPGKVKISAPHLQKHK